MFSAGDKFDKYTIRRLLGEGGMALVYEATNPFGVSVVLKMLHPNLVGSEEVRERFHREGRIQYTLKHPHIVRVTDIVEHDGVPALVVDFMRGEDLEQRMMRGVPLSVDEVVQISTCLLDGLQLAHEHGFFHRDLKPSNIFLETTDSGFEARLMDFGIAKVSEAAELTRAQEFCGTPAYASPEQIASTRDVDHMTDIYSFGVVMWAMCNGHDPYDDRGDDPYAVLAAVVRETLPPLSSDIPRWLRTVVETATQKDAELRYPTAASFRDAILAGASDDSPVLPESVVNLKFALQETGRMSHSAFPMSDDDEYAPTVPQVDLSTIRPPSAPRPVAAAPAALPPSQARRSVSASVSASSDSPRSESSRSSSPRSESRPSRSATPPVSAPPVSPPRATPARAVSRSQEGSTSSPRPAASTTSDRRPTRSEAAHARRVARSFDRSSSNRGLYLKLGLGFVAMVALGVGAAVGVSQFGGLSRTAPEGFVRIEPGAFTMGSPETEPGHGTDETEHAVTITRPFALSITEVTQAQWTALMFGSSGSFPECGDECPMTNVSWHDAIQYANRRSIESGLAPCYQVSGNDVAWPEGLDCEGYRLPTEAEWEFAARAGSDAAFANGDLVYGGRSTLDPHLALIGWYGANSDATYQGASDCSGWGEGRDECGPARVQTRRVNAWGLYDMHGNVSEWVWDRYAAYAGAETDPTGAATGSQRVVRGGSWRDTSESCRSAARERSGSVGRNNIGFRLARSLR